MTGATEAAEVVTEAIEAEAKDKVGISRHIEDSAED